MNTELARAMFIALTEGSAFVGIDGSSTWETATTDEAKGKWIKMAATVISTLEESGYTVVPLDPVIREPD